MSDEGIQMRPIFSSQAAPSMQILEQQQHAALQLLDPTARTLDLSQETRPLYPISTIMNHVYSKENKEVSIC